MRTILVSLLALLALAACNPIKSDRQENSLRKTLWAYEQTVRWGELYKIWGFQTDELQETNPPPGNPGPPTPPPTSSPRSSTRICAVCCPGTRPRPE